MIGLDAYDRIAPHYRAIAARRSRYLDAVDGYILAHCAQGVRMLDVGSGDGVRATAIARTIAASRIVLCEPSARMAALCREQNVDAVWERSAEDLGDVNERFDVITCLWNVLGHLEGRPARIAALNRMRALLAPDGRIFCDVNNRHNARAYGHARVVLRRIIDGVAPSDARGDSRFEWNVHGERIPVSGHLFTPGEMQRLVKAAELEVEDQVAVDYLSGAMSRSQFDGQLLFRLRPEMEHGMQ